MAKFIKEVKICKKTTSDDPGPCVTINNNRKTLFKATSTTSVNESFTILKVKRVLHAIDDDLFNDIASSRPLSHLLLRIWLATTLINMLCSLQQYVDTSLWVYLTAAYCLLQLSPTIDSRVKGGDPLQLGENAACLQDSYKWPRTS